MCDCIYMLFFFFSSRRRHTRCSRDWSSDVCSSDLSSLEQPTSDRCRGTWVDRSSPLFVLCAVAHVPSSRNDSSWASSPPHEHSRDPHVNPSPSFVTPEWQEREESDIICCEKFPPFRE